MSSRVGAVVVTYNRREMLGQCITSLLAQTVPCDVLVIDNASTDGTGEWMQTVCQENSQVHYKNTGKNLGGAGGFNCGMRWAVEAGYEFVWIMDDDCLPKEDALEKLLEADQILSGEYGWLSSAALWTDGRECKMNRQALKKSYFEYMHLICHGLIQAKHATFISLFLRAETILKFGLPIKDYYIWGDDLEYTRRIAVRGKVPCFLAGQSQVVHAMKTNQGSSIALDMPERIARYNYAFRNENHLYRQEGLGGLAYYSAKCALNLLRILRFAKEHRLKRCAIIIKQYICGFFFNPRVEYVKMEEEK